MQLYEVCMCGTCGGAECSIDILYQHKSPTCNVQGSYLLSYMVLETSRFMFITSQQHSVRAWINAHHVHYLVHFSNVLSAFHDVAITYASVTICPC